MPMSPKGPQRRAADTSGGVTARPPIMVRTYTTVRPQVARYWTPMKPRTIKAQAMRFDAARMQARRRSLSTSHE